MTTYSTGNPLGSSDPRDLYDNAENLDNLVNGGQAAYNDRLGKSRKSWQGMEEEFAAFIAASGYQFAGDYAAGIEITQYNQVVRDSSGEFWRVSGSTELPYTTTGAGLPEGGAFVYAGDAVLRQELVNPGIGAAMVARGVVAVDSIAGLLNLSAGQRREDLRYFVASYHLAGDDRLSLAGTQGGSMYVWSPTAQKSAHDGGRYIDPDKDMNIDWYTPAPDGLGCFVRLGEANADAYGTRGTGDADDQPALQKYLRSADEERLSSVFLPMRSNNYLVQSPLVIQEPIMINGDKGATYNRGDGKSGNIVIGSGTEYAMDLGNSRTRGETTDIDAGVSTNPSDNWAVKNIGFVLEEGTPLRTKTGIIFTPSTNGPDRGLLLREVSAVYLGKAIHITDQG